MKYQRTLTIWVSFFVFEIFCIAGSSADGGFTTANDNKLGTQIPINPGKNELGNAQIHLENVTNPSAFLSELKILPVLEIGNMSYRVEYEEASEDDKMIQNARIEIGETKEKIEAAKEKLVQLLKGDTILDVPLENDAWLIRFLRVKKLNVELTYKLIKAYYEFKANNPHVYNGLIPNRTANIFGKNILTVMPNRDLLQRRMLIMRIKKWHPKEVSLLDLFKQAILIAEASAYEPVTQTAGVLVIIDLKGFSWQHVWQFKPTIAKSMIDYLQYSVPFRLKGLHIIHQSFIFEMVYTLFKPFITHSLNKKIFFHDNLHSLHKHVNASSLPDVYDGTVPLPEISADEWFEILKYGDQEFAKIMSYGIGQGKPIVEDKRH